MEQDEGKGGELVRIDQGKIRAELGELVRGTVEETLNGLLEAEAASLCQANRYERRDERKDMKIRGLRSGVRSLLSACRVTNPEDLTPLLPLL